ncbi:zinc-ribbon domain-containing protein [Secundilactobacillus yichangensis]|uniref:zinc-ribbon domain-containing protein n=1 Tax=Secundilactobacillus yichangensis TaxID=2799580 RepID=UPI001944D07C|nr:zinc ribbon domain-containing protein [Secundilactobacillus yichangensis]
MENTRFCNKCGKEIPIDSEFCPYCGATQPKIDAVASQNVQSASGDANHPSQSKNTTANLKQKPKNRLWLWLALLIVIIVVSGGGYAAYAHHEAVKRQETIAANNASFNEYHDDFIDQSQKIGTNLENLGNDVQTAWHDAIFEDAGAKVNGKYYTDFNKATQAVFDKYTANGKVDKILKEKSDIKEDYKLMQRFKTKDKQSSFDDVKNTYQDVKTMYSTVTNPTGTYNDFSSAFSKADNDLGSDLN